MTALHAAVEDVLDALVAAHRAKDAAALARLYTADARIADLAPPLARRGFDRPACQAWFDGWEGPVDLEMRDLDVVDGGDVVLCHGLQHTRAHRSSGETAAWWSRFTLAVARTEAGWRIVHHHDSVPFHMDGSFRAAVDLHP